MPIEDDHVLTEEDRQAVAAPRTWFQQNPKGGLTFEQFVEECGFTMEKFSQPGRTLISDQADRGSAATHATPHCSAS